MREALLLVALASGCTLAPKHVTPEAPVAATFPVPSEGERAAAEIGWREFFPDARLQALIGAALEHNRDLRTAALRVEESRALHRIVVSDQLPGLGATAGMAMSHTPEQVSPVGQGYTIRQYQVGVALPAFELDLFGRLRSLSRAALAEHLATEEGYLSVRIALVAEVASAALAEQAAAEQLALAERSLAGREQAHALARQRFEAGVSSELELRQSETLVASAEVAVATLARQRAQARHALTLLAGAPLGELPEPTPLHEQRLVTDIPAGLPSEVLTRRPDIRAAEHRLRAANADIGAARAAFFPRIALTGSVGTASSELTGLFGGGTGIWSFVPQLVQPIFAWGRNRANLDVAEVRKDLAVVAYERAVQVAFREVADALVARATFDDQVAAQERLRDAQAERLRLAEQRYDNGVASFLEVLDAERALFDAEQALVRARQLRLANAIDLYRSLGGGLDPQDAR